LKGISQEEYYSEIVVNDGADVYTDLNQINLVMRNLIDNAIKFNPLNQYIHIKIWGNESFVYIDICNPVTGVLDINLLRFRIK